MTVAPASSGPLGEPNVHTCTTLTPNAAQPCSTGSPVPPETPQHASVSARQGATSSSPNMSRPASASKVVSSAHAMSLMARLMNTEGSSGQSSSSAPKQRRAQSAGRARPDDSTGKPSGSSRLQTLEHPKSRNDVQYTTKPIGDPVVRELNPVSPSQVIRLKHRAATLIQRYAGANWQAAQRTKWMIDVVTHIDKDYREYIMDQAYQIQHLQRQIEIMQDKQAGSLALANAKIHELETLAREQQSQLRESAAALLDLQTRLTQSEAALSVAEEAATASVQELRALQDQISSQTEHDARARKMLAHQAYTLKSALRDSRSHLRQNTEAVRRHNMEVTAMLHLKEEEMAREKTALTSQFTNQLAAVHQVERAAAQVEVAHVRMELEAYKEPWVYAYGKVSPTKDKDRALALGLKPSSLNCLKPPC